MSHGAHHHSRVAGAAHRDSTIAFVMAVLVAVFFPVAARAGTETPLLRYLTAALLGLAGLALHVGGHDRRIQVGGLVVLAGVPLVYGAVWPAVLALLFAVDLGVARLRDASAAARETQPAPPAHPEHHEEHTAEIVESIATAFVLALIVREFAFEAFKIPTGSMQPTILGDSGNRKGDRLLAAKGPLLFGDPERWSIMVFKYPLFRQTNYIKRLVGMPGEHLQIRKGDIYVDGRVVAKPEEVQESLWAQVFPVESSTYRGSASGSFVPDGIGEWTFEPQDSATGTVPAGRTGWAIFDADCPDARVSFELDAAELSAHASTPTPGAVFIRLDGDGRRVELELSREGVWLTAQFPSGTGVERRKLDMDGLGTGTQRIGFAVADRVVRVYRGGRLAARIETADQAAPSSGQQDHVWLGVSGGKAQFRKIRVERDLQYGTDYSPNEWKIPAGCYFMLGDNTHASRDSRAWSAKVFRTLDGKEYVADESVRLDDEHSVTNIRPWGDGWEFHDSYGVKRRLTRAEVVDGGPVVEKQPFVRREDLVGRAFLIFFPFPPLGDWRPRILP